MRDQVGSYIRYPAAVAGYEELKNNPKMFMDTLEKFHSFMGTKFMIPIIGGKELDLHRLFVEVTQRGGIQKILDEKRWKEVTATFNFPSTATNASFVLRKYYMSLLQHYEQLYFFRAQGWNVAASAASLQNPSPQNQAAAQQHNGINVAAELPGASGLPSIVGVIDGKFDSGYLVTVTIGNEKLQGVVYQAATESQQQYYYGLSANNNNNETTDSGVVRRKRRRKEIQMRDPNQLLLGEAAGQCQQPEQQDVDMVVEPGRGTRVWETPLDNESSSSDDEVDSDDDDDEEDHEKNVASVAVAAGEDLVGREETRPVEGLGVLPS
ncbi:unnamed protein product [Linum trigynum]|uniref:ARID domain-containing protein n=1 Tax=Linum trigynum TaxID=586398 RepID=A0AAV2GJJ9_9ROSI